MTLAAPALADDDGISIGFAVAQSGWMNAYDGLPVKAAHRALENADRIFAFATA
jgi:hypothetical protein